MTVKELIEILKEYNDDKVVVINVGEGNVSRLRSVTHYCKSSYRNRVRLNAECYDNDS